MLSFSKILLILAVIAGVFYAVKLLRPKAGRRVAKRGRPQALDLRKCAVCGVYVGEADGACGKPDCPAA